MSDVEIFRDEYQMLTGVRIRTAIGTFQEVCDEHGRAIDLSRERDPDMTVDLALQHWRYVTRQFDSFAMRRSWRR